MRGLVRFDHRINDVEERSRNRSMRVHPCSLPVADLHEIDSHFCPGASRLVFAQALKSLFMSTKSRVSGRNEHC